MNLFKLGKEASAMKALPHADRLWLWERTVDYASEQLSIQRELARKGDDKAPGRIRVIEHGLRILNLLDMSR